MKNLPSAPLVWICAALALTGLSACTPPAPKASEDDQAAMLAQGYASAPRITEVKAAAAGLVSISGQALPNSRVRLQYGGDHAVGVTADSKGRYHADVPLGSGGGIIDISSVEGSGRELQADGRLFVPPGAPQKAVLLRAGSPSQPLVKDRVGVAVVDYDAAGAMLITGVAKPNDTIAVTVGDISWPKQPKAGPDGLFTATCQIPPLDEQAGFADFVVTAGGVSWTRTVPVSAVAGGDVITPISGGWRVDWVVGGGGRQTAVIF